jgi:glycosyltransferase involved in cell wall biosynthesis
MQKILINGYFLCRNLTGIERFAHEITKRLDNLIARHEIALIIPRDSKNIPSYKNLEIILYKKKQPHIWWQMITLQFFLLTHREYTVLEFANTCLPLSPGIVFLHDIYCKLFPEDFTTLYDKITCLYNKWQYHLIAGKAKKIITVSRFSQKQIALTYHIDPERIAVVYNGWEHFRDIIPDYSIFDAHPELKKQEYFFTLGSLSRRKNLKWIIAYAAAHPDAFFAISGTSLPTLKDQSAAGAVSCPNILLLGYLDDPRVKALMEKCRAFILPSYYEGFGIPPLEALSCGAPIIISNAASLPEIYGNTAHYIDPFNYDINLDIILRQPVEDPGAVLEKYSYDAAARQVLNIIRGC